MYQDAGGQTGERRRKRLGLVLSGGAARGLAHLGVLSVLEEQGVRVDLIVGASFGSIAGGLYACGIPSVRVLSMVRAFFASRGKSGNGHSALWEHAERAFQRELGDVRIEDTRIPLRILAIDLSDETVRVFSQGPLFTAVKASSAFPGLFDPLLIDGHLYVDGGILNSMLLKVAHDEGAEPILFSDASFFGVIYRKRWLNTVLDAVLRLVPGYTPRPLRDPAHVSELRLVPRILSVIKRYKRDCEIYREKWADLIITPRLEGVRPLDFGKIEFIVKRGRQAAAGSMDAVHGLAKLSAGTDRPSGTVSHRFSE
jgi:predicted acylesterase/phospholipase RssA